MRVCVSVSVSVSVCVCVCVCVCVYVCACADLEEQEIQELLAEQEGDGEEVEQRSKRPHLDSCPDATSGHPLSTLHVHQA